MKKLDFVLDGSEPLSKALSIILSNGTIAVITDKGKYYGIIDDRNIRPGISDPSKTKAIRAAVRAPYITEDMTLPEIISAFLAGHFKALPLIKNDKVVSIFSRSDLMAKLKEAAVVPAISLDVVMKKPLYTIQETETIGTAKKIMKELSVHRLAVLKGNRLVGTISTFDMSMFLLKPKSRDRFSLISEVKNPDSKLIKDVMREELVTINYGKTLLDAVEKMAKNNVSALVVVEKGKPIGKITSVDVMKFVLSLLTPKPEIYISGMTPELMFYYDDTKTQIQSLLDKLGKFVELKHPELHIKSGKSMYYLNFHIFMDNVPITIRSEDHEYGKALHDLLSEIKALIRKKQNYIKRIKKRNTYE